MDWSNERYLRLYTRDTGDWLLWPWQSRALFVFILRKVDRAGLLQLGKGHFAALARIVDMPLSDVTEFVEPLIDDGCVRIRDGALCVPNYLAAQETLQNDRVRKQASRERTRERFLAEKGETPKGDPTPVESPVDGDEDMTSMQTERTWLSRSSVESPVDGDEDMTPCDVESQPVTVGHSRSRLVTDCHTESQPVTVGHSVPSLSVPNHAESQTRTTPAEVPKPEPAPEPEPSPPPKPPSSDPESGYDLAKRVWSELWSAKYKRPYPFDWVTAGPRSEKHLLQGFGGMALERGGARAEDFARHWVAAYLRDKGDRSWLDEHAHPLRCLARDIAKYGEPKPSASLTRVRASPAVAEPPPLSVAEQAARAQQLASSFGKIGMGGGR